MQAKNKIPTQICLEVFSTLLMSFNMFILKVNFLFIFNLHGLSRVSKNSGLMKQLTLNMNHFLRNLYEIREEYSRVKKET